MIRIRGMMINFTVGPVQAGKTVLDIGSQQVPYFRTPEFSAIMKENERLLLSFLDAPLGSRAVFLTGSGTASMESVVMNTLNGDDRALVVDGGSFGHRFCQLCQIHGIDYDPIELDPGKTLKESDLVQFENGSYTAFLVNLDETSTGTLYDLELISGFCKRKGLFLIIDAISSFLADPIDMEGSGAGAIIVGSQKALACPPGVSAIALSAQALNRISRNPTKCMYLDLKTALIDAERGQTPFTPAVSILLQINVRLQEIAQNGGAASEVERVCALARYFRDQIAGLRLSLLSESPSNAVTALVTEQGRADDVFSFLKNEYGIWVCPNGGQFAKTVFRVGHIGNLQKEDYDILVGALSDLQVQNII